MKDTPDPELNPSATAEAPKASNRFMVVMAALGVLVLGLIAFVVYQGSLLKVVSLNPTLDKITTATPSLTISFNKTLDATGASVVSSPATISSYTISGKDLKINFNTPMGANVSYTITIKTISSGSSKLTNQSYTFTPTQSTSLAQQPNIDQPNGGPYFTGTESLGDYGLSPQQIGGVQSALLKYKSSLQNADIDTGSISAVAHDPNSASPWDYVTFNVTIDGQKFAARLGYSDITKIQLLLTDSTKAKLVFDSGVIDTSSN